MAYSKAQHFEDRDVMAARYSISLSLPARLSILRLLNKQSSCYCGDLVNDLPIAQATVSQHLKELKDAGVIDGEITPPKVRYCINRENFEQARLYFKDLFM